MSSKTKSINSFNKQNNYRIVRTISGKNIKVRDDNYVCSNDMLFSEGKEWCQYIKCKRTKKYLEELGIALNKEYDELIQGTQKNRWICPDLAIHFAQWISPRFAVFVSNIIKSLIFVPSERIEYIKLFNENKLLKSDISTYKEKEKIYLDKEEKIKILEKSLKKCKKYKKYKEELDITKKELSSKLKYISELDTKICNLEKKVRELLLDKKKTPENVIFYENGDISIHNYKSYKWNIRDSGNILYLQKK